LNGAERLLGERALARYGAHTALLCGEETLTYGELANRLRAASAALRAAGIAPGDRVLLLMRDTPQFAATWLGAVHAGAVPVALNNRLPERDYRHILSDSDARLVIVEDVFMAARPDLGGELAAAKRLAIAGERPAAGAPSWDAQCAAASVASATPCAVDASTAAFALYSSGTTGRPKGILHGHRVFAQLGAAFRTIGVGEGDRVFGTSKFFFAYGLEHGLLAPLAVGGTAILFPDWPDAAAVVATLERHRPAALFSVPTTYRRLLAEPAARAALGTVQRLVAAGERLSPQLVEHGRRATGREILNLYGMSETFCACMMTAPGESDGLRTGKPFPGVELRLEPPTVDETVSGTGVLWVRHPAQALGYVNRPEEQEAQFRDGWFCSRDLFCRDGQGFYVHLGRSDELVKVAGQWVQPGELEEVAAGEPSVVEAACVPVEDADGRVRLALFVTARGDDAQAAERDAAAACERLLPRHKRPRWIRAVAELPRTATGKVQRFRLREILERELRGGG
jgi:benzoate-CoA ligase